MSLETAITSGHEPLHDFPLFATSDVDEARDKVARVFCPHRLVPTAKNPRLDARHNRAELDGISLNYIQYGSEIGIEPGTLGSFFLLQISLIGKAHVSSGGVTVAASSDAGTLLSPSLDVSMVWSDGCAKLLVQITRTTMERTLEALLDRHIGRPIEFALAFPLRAAQARIAALTRLWQDDLDSRDGIFSRGLLGAQMRESLVEGLLKCHPHTYTAALASTCPGIAPKHVRRAEDFMRHNIGKSLTLEEIARASGSSVRALQTGFRRFRGVTPLETLRSLRMRAAREDLMRASPGDSVTAIALRWGFPHLSRFSVAYRVRYGEPPSETLHKSAQR